MADESARATILRMTQGAAVGIAVLLVLWLGLLGYVVVKSRDQQSLITREQVAIVATQRENKRAECRVRSSVQSVLDYFATLQPLTQQDRDRLTHARGLLVDPECPPKEVP